VEGFKDLVGDLANDSDNDNVADYYDKSPGWDDNTARSAGETWLVDSGKWIDGKQLFGHFDKDRNFQAFYLRTLATETDGQPMTGVQIGPGGIGVQQDPNGGFTYNYVKIH
jgi:hypothetical protein